MAIAYFISQSIGDGSTAENGVRPVICDEPSVIQWETAELDEALPGTPVYFIRLTTTTQAEMDALKNDVSGLWEWIADV